jgi:hypothetical protein
VYSKRAQTAIDDEIGAGDKLLSSEAKNSAATAIASGRSRRLSGVTA